jgi:predicted dehydrogenase
MSIKIAFVGTGYINKIHAICAKTAGAELAAVVNHKPESMVKFAAEFGIPRQYTTLEALLKDGGVDALVVSTPNYLHAEQTIAALKAGIHVLVEKPMSMNAIEAEAMQKAAEKSGKTLMLAHCWRFDTEAIWLREQIAAGRIGKIIRTKGCSVHVNWGPGGWFAQKKFAGGGAMADMGVHALDTARFLLGDPQPVSVYAKIGTYYGSYDVDDTGLVIVNWDNDATSYFESGWWQPHADQPNAGTQLYGQAGFASLFPTRVETLNANREVILDEGGFAPQYEHKTYQAMYDRQMKYFIDCVQEGRTPVPGGMEGLTNMLIVDAAYKSSHTGKVVEL